MQILSHISLRYYNESVQYCNIDASLGCVCMCFMIRCAIELFWWSARIRNVRHRRGQCLTVSLFMSSSFAARLALISSILCGTVELPLSNRLIVGTKSSVFAIYIRFRYILKTEVSEVVDS